MAIEALLSLKALLVGGAFVFFALYERLQPAADSPLLVRFGRAAAGAQRQPVRDQPPAVAARRATDHRLGGKLQPRAAPGLVDRLAGPDA
jgi:hypothetical protein